MPEKWWVMRPIETPASALIRRTDTPSWPKRLRQTRVAAMSSSRRAPGDSRRNFGAAAPLDRLTGPRPQTPQATLDVFLVEVDPRQSPVARVGITRVQHAPVVEQQHRAREQPPAVLERGIVAERVERSESAIERTLARRGEGEG